MSRQFDQLQLAARHEIVEAPVLRACDSHGFDLPVSIFAAMALMFAGAVAILVSAFRGHMLLSYGIVFAFLFAFFAVPTIFVKASPRDGGKAMSWARFREVGLETATGHTGAGEATVLSLLLPFVVLCWAVAITIIAATVS